jgi:predicted permease
MQLLTIFVNVLVPVLTVALIGYLAGPRLGLDGRPLSRIAYYILAPAFIFNLFSEAHIELALALRMAAFIYLVTTGCVVIAMILARAMGHRGAMVSAFILVAAFGNVGNFGLPIISFGLGEAALIPASVYFLLLSPYGFIVGVTAAAWGRGSARQAFISAVTTPAILAVIPALFVNWLNLPMPLVVQRPIGLLASAMIPTMLLTLGMQLGSMGRPKLSLDVAAASSVRLLAGPLLAFALAALIGLTGLPRGAGILQASMPSAVFAVLIALEYDLLPDFVTTTVLFSTLASAATLTLVLSLL